MFNSFVETTATFAEFQKMQLKFAEKFKNSKYAIVTGTLKSNSAQQKMTLAVLQKEKDKLQSGYDTWRAKMEATCKRADRRRQTPADAGRRRQTKCTKAQAVAHHKFISAFIFSWSENW